MAKDNQQIATDDMQQTIYKELGYKSYPFPFTTPAYLEAYGTLVGLKPPTAQEAFQAKKKVALKKIERDFADEAIRSNFDKFKGDAVKLAQEFTPEELALYILSLTVQDPETMPEVEIAREKPLPFKPSGGGFGGKGGKGGRGNRGRDNNRRGGYRGDRNRDDRDGGRRDFKRKSKKNSRDFENRGNKRPHRTSSEKKNGFVIRNKGDK